MSDFEVHTAREPDRIVVAPSGDCDLRSRDELTSTLHTAVRAAPLVVVDLAQVRFLDSSGLHALISARQAARESAHTLWVVNARGTVATILDMTGVIELLRPPEGAGLSSATPPRQP